MTEGNPLSKFEKFAQNIQAASSFAEVFRAIGEVGYVTGSTHVYPAAELEHEIVQELGSGQGRFESLPRSGGLRDKLKDLYILVCISPEAKATLIDELNTFLIE